MSRTKFGEGTRWVTCTLMAFSLIFFVAQNLPAEEYPLGDIPLPEEVYQKHLKVRADKFVLLDAAPPASYDARDEGIVTSAKDQGYCGSCWAFATVGAMESHLLKTFNINPSDLSEQQQVSCNVANYGCCGGYSSAARYWETNGPIHEPCFLYGDSNYGTSCPPYSGVDCSDSGGCEELVYRVVDWHTVDATPTGFKTSLYEDGPSYWRYTVYSDFYTFWNTGSPGEVYYQTSSTYRGGHAVLLIGWDDTKGAYLCKNSWGTYGGPNGDGTFWIAYSGHVNDLGFGMSNFSVTGGAECGDGTCDPDEDECNCAIDCGYPPTSEVPGQTCNDGLDNDCDSVTDCDDPDCDPVCICDNDGECDQDENCNTCPQDCISGQGGTCGACFKGVCNGECHPKKEGPECADCAPDYCCGDGVCEGAEDSYNCEIDCGPPPFCGDTQCDGGEDQCNCPYDCDEPPATEVGLCSDGIDNDCDGPLDCADGDCDGEPACDCYERGVPCSENGECCSGRCHRGKCK